MSNGESKDEIHDVPFITCIHHAHRVLRALHLKVCQWCDDFPRTHRASFHVLAHSREGNYTFKDAVQGFGMGFPNILLDKDFHVECMCVCVRWGGGQHMSRFVETKHG